MSGRDLVEPNCHVVDLLQSARNFHQKASWRVNDKAERKKLEEEMGEAVQKMQALYKQVPPVYENHGWVWLFKRQPAEAEAAAR